MLQKIKTNWRAFVIFAQTAQKWMMRHPEKTKFGWALQRVCTQYTAFDTEMQEKIEDADHEFCYTEKRGDKEVITRDAHGNLEFDKTEDGKRILRHRELNKKDDLLVQPMYGVYKIPDDLSDAELEAFCGFVISPDQVDAIRAKRDAWLNEPDEDDKAESAAPGNGASQILPNNETEIPHGERTTSDQDAR